ncbi:hypothetical protein TNCV_1750781 [Trichonephila clavipes]|nr:hypothetical protein TNCV_1750781 [Trichonephila clavipes]
MAPSNSKLGPVVRKQEESIRIDPESVVANGAVLARGRKTKLPRGGATMTEMVPYIPTLHRVVGDSKVSSFYLCNIVTSSKDRTP